MSTTRTPAQPMSEWIAAYPQLDPVCVEDCSRCDLFWTAQIRLSSPWVKRPHHEIERRFSDLMAELGIDCVYEPFFLEVGMRANGIPRGFQPDFWIPELGLMIELCRRVENKNQKVRLAQEHWPDLPVLVLSDDTVGAMIETAISRQEFIDATGLALAWQAERIAWEGDDPHGYRIPRPSRLMRLWRRLWRRQ